MFTSADYLQMSVGFLVSFLSVGLRAFQTKNMIGNHKRLILFTSYFITGSEIAAIGLIVSNGWMMWIPMGTGAGLGALTSMILHDRFVKPRG